MCEMFVLQSGLEVGVGRLRLVACGCSMNAWPRTSVQERFRSMAIS
jgi:hypothetical protein